VTELDHFKITAMLQSSTGQQSNGPILIKLRRYIYCVKDCDSCIQEETKFNLNSKTLMNADLNKDGQTDASELSQLLQKQFNFAPRVAKENAKQIIKLFDTDNSGALEVDEMTNLTEELVIMTHQHKKKLLTSKEIDKSSKPEITPKILKDRLARPQLERRLDTIEVLLTVISEAKAFKISNRSGAWMQLGDRASVPDGCQLFWIDKDRRRTVNATKEEDTFKEVPKCKGKHSVCMQQRAD